MEGGQRCAVRICEGLSGIRYKTLAYPARRGASLRPLHAMEYCAYSFVFESSNEYLYLKYERVAVV